MTVYLPVPGILRCPYPCCAGCQARTSVSLRLSAWRSHMEQKHGVRPTRRLYRCVACDARLNSLSARHDCPGPASNEPFHPWRYCTSYFNCERSLARHTMARHAQEESTLMYLFAPHGSLRRLPPVLLTSWRPVFHIDLILEYQVGLQHYGYRFSIGVKLRGVYHAGPLLIHFWLRLSTPQQSPLVLGTPPSVPPDPGPQSTTGEVSSTPGSSSRRHTGPASTASASRASSRMSTELSDVPGTDDSDDASANEPVDEQTDDDAHDTPVEAPTMEMPPDRTMLLAEQVRVLRATLRSAPTPDSWATCEQAWSQAVALAAEAVRLPPSTPGRPARDVNPDNATQIQRLYRRNRRRGGFLW
ncbi:hypothetical protein MRX96_018170 [Rhipicephalus microplus]